MATTIEKSVPAAEEPAARPEPPTGGGWAQDTGDLVLLVVRSVRIMPRTFRYGSEILRQAAIIARGTWLLMLVLNVFLGMSVVTFAFFVLRSLGAGDVVGTFSGVLTPRQTAVTMFGYVIAGKVCCGIAAEIGAMKIQEEIDAMEVMGLDPVMYVVNTRVLGTLLFVPLGCAIALAGQFLGGFLDAVHILQGLPGPTFEQAAWAAQGIGEQVFALVTMALVAVPCAYVACFFGLRTHGGPDAVGVASARSLMVNLVLVHVITAFAAVAYYGTDLRLAIGG